MKKIIAVWLVLSLVVMLPQISTAASRGLRISVDTSDGQELFLYENSYALVVGNGNYTRGWDPLGGAITDAKDVSRALKKVGFEVILKTNLTKDDFNKTFGEFVLTYGKNENSRLLFYYAGHGHTEKMATGEELGYLVMVDAPLPEKDALGFNLSSVDMQTLVTQAKRIRSRHVLYMFDSCFSGSILNFREHLLPQNITASVKYPVRQFITAGRANEPVPDHSVFKQAFVDLLEGRDKEPIPDGYLTGEELGLYLKNKVPQYNAYQHPQYGKIKDIRLDKGDFVFVMKRPESSIQPEATVAPLPPETGGIKDYDAIIQKRKAAKDKWEDWQKNMERDFAKAQTYDRNTELTAEEKKGVWSAFLSSYSADNPYATKDDSLRTQARERLNQWKNYKVAMGRRPSETGGKTWKDPVTGMEFVWVPGGCFKMGSPSSEDGRGSDEGPVHEVCVHGFWMGKYEVTNQEFRKFRSSHSSKDYKGNSLNGDNQPAVYVSWDDAKSFVDWLSSQNNNRFKFRLPTEAEWEYACRAGTQTARFWGDSPAAACQYANVHDNKSKRVNKFKWEHHNCDDGYAVTAPAGSFRPNGFGLYDMLGNIWEWCEDIYAKDAYSKHEKNNPIYANGGSSRVLRGGSWGNDPRRVRCADRSWDNPGVRDGFLGFRLLRTP
jgi:formylglycine-generating enzyme required for sulfatase activity